MMLSLDPPRDDAEAQAYVQQLASIAADALNRTLRGFLDSQDS
ncbi:MAG: hypothetical protein ACKVHU_20760 [Acidimicrobiales bacterium]